MIKLQYHPSLGASIVDANSGDIVPCSEATIRLSADLPPVLELRLVSNFQGSIVADEKWWAKHPKTAERKFVKAIIFEDGSIWNA